MRLDDAEHDRTDKGDGNIGRHHAELADESHGKSPWLASIASPVNANRGTSVPGMRLGPTPVPGGCGTGNR